MTSETRNTTHVDELTPETAPVDPRAVTTPLRRRERGSGGLFKMRGLVVDHEAA
jgi:hypothetical protein